MEMPMGSIGEVKKSRRDYVMFPVFAEILE
jgi:hypothetical protein